MVSETSPSPVLLRHDDFSSAASSIKAMNLPKPPRPTKPTNFGRVESAAGQVVFGILAVGAFVAGFLANEGWHWVGISMVIVIPIWAGSVRARYDEEREALRNWPFVQGKLLQIKNIAPDPGSVLVLAFSYEWQRATHRGERKFTALASTIDLHQPIWLLVNPERPWEFKFVEELKLVEVDLKSLTSHTMAGEDGP